MIRIAIGCFVYLFILSSCSRDSKESSETGTSEYESEQSSDQNMKAEYPLQALVELDMDPAEIGPEWARPLDGFGRIQKFRYTKGEDSSAVYARVVWMGGSERAEATLKSRMDSAATARLLPGTPVAYEVTQENLRIPWNLRIRYSAIAGYWLVVLQEGKADTRGAVISAYTEKLEKLLKESKEDDSDLEAGRTRPVPSVVDIPALPELSELGTVSEDDWGATVHKMTLNWLGHGQFELVIRAEGGWNSVAKDNYNALRDRWHEFMERALNAINDQITGYEHEAYGPEPRSDVFLLELPAESISNGGVWSFSVDSEPCWVIDLQGWEVVGGDGVF